MAVFKLVSPMSQITNLNRFRKQKARDEARDKAGIRAASFGRTKAQKAAEADASVRAARHLDAHRRTPEGAAGGDQADGGDE